MTRALAWYICIDLKKINGGLGHYCRNYTVSTRLVKTTKRKRGVCDLPHHRQQQRRGGKRANVINQIIKNDSGGKERGSSDKRRQRFKEGCDEQRGEAFLYPLPCFAPKIWVEIYPLVCL